MANQFPQTLEPEPAEPFVEKAESEQAYLSLQPAWAAMPDDELQPTNNDIRRASSVVLGSLDNIRRHLGALAAAGVTERMLAELRTCALGAWEADSRLSGTAKAGPSLQPLLQEGAQDREVLKSIVTTAVLLGDMDGEVLKNLKNTQGFEGVTHVDDRGMAREFGEVHR